MCEILHLRGHFWPLGFSLNGCFAPGNWFLGQKSMILRIIMMLIVCFQSKIGHNSNIYYLYLKFFDGLRPSHVYFLIWVVYCISLPHCALNSIPHYFKQSMYLLVVVECGTKCERRRRKPIFWLKFKVLCPWVFENVCPYITHCQIRCLYLFRHHLIVLIVFQYRYLLCHGQLHHHNW